MFFVERLKQIAQVAMTVIDAIAAIAAGVIVPAANKVEQTMAGLLTLVISFLARLIGLGNVSEAVGNVIAKVRAPIDKALDRVVEWIVATATKIGKLVAGAAKGAVAKVKAWWARTAAFQNAAGEAHTLALEERGDVPALVIRTDPKILEDYLKTLPPPVRGLPEVRQVEALSNGLKPFLKEGFSARTGEKIARDFAEIVRLLAQIADSEAPSPMPPTIVKWPASKTVSVRHPSASSEALSASMVADPLTINPGGNAGAPPSHVGKFWSSVNRRGAYERGHLLSQKLFGPGTAQNLVPITISLNQWMQSNVESKVKDLVLNQKRMVRFEVQVQFGGHKGRANLPDESELPMVMSFSLKLYKYDGKAWVVDTQDKLPVKSKRHELPADEPLQDQVTKFNAWQARVGAAKPPIRAYRMDETYAVGEVLDHPTFGRGVVERLRESGKIEVTFRRASSPSTTEELTLVSGKR